MFTFNFNTFERIKKGAAQQPITARMIISDTQILAGESSGYLQIIGVPNMEITETFQLSKQGVVSEIKKTMRGDREGNNELAVGTYKGIYFVKYDTGFKFTED